MLSIISEQLIFSMTRKILPDHSSIRNVSESGEQSQFTGCHLKVSSCESEVVSQE